METLNLLTGSVQDIDSGDSDSGRLLCSRYNSRLVSQLKNFKPGPGRSIPTAVRKKELNMK